MYVLFYFGLFWAALLEARVDWNPALIGYSCWLETSLIYLVFNRKVYTQCELFFAIFCYFGMHNLTSIVSRLHFFVEIRLDFITDFQFLFPGFLFSFGLIWSFAFLRCCLRFTWRWNSNPPATSSYSSPGPVCLHRFDFSYHRFDFPLSSRVS